MVVSNLTTPEELERAIGMQLANADQWCYAMHDVLGLAPCPAPDLFGFPIVNGVRTPAQVSASVFLDNLRNYEVGLESATQGPGGTHYGGTVPAPATGGTIGQGVLGPTNCEVCQAIAKNPWMLVILGVALYFLLVRD